MEIALLADSWRVDWSGFLKLVAGIPSNFGAMKTEIEGKQWLIPCLFG